MLGIIDKYDEIWGWPIEKGGCLYAKWETGQEEPLTADQVFFCAGKYRGTKLSDVDDERYLRWCLQVSDEESPRYDWFVSIMVKMRLAELH